MLLGAYLFFTVFALWGLSASNITLDEAEHGFWARDVMVKLLDLAGNTRHYLDYSPRYYTGPFFFISPALRPDILLPVMTCSFTGALIIYFIVPFMFVFGQTVFALKIGFILLGAATAWCVYYTTRHFLGKTTGTLTAFVLLTNSFFIKQARAGAETESTLQIFFFWSGAALICRALKTGKATPVYFALFAWGLALWAKIMFFPFIVGLAVSVLFVHPSIRRQIKQHISALKISWVWAFLFLFAGAFPLVYYNTQTLGATLNQSVQTLLTGKNHNNMRDGNLAYRLGIRSKQINDTILKRDSFPLDRAGGHTTNPVNAMFTVIALLAVIKSAFRPKNATNTQAAFLKTGVITYATIYLFSGFSPGSYAAEHMGVLIPGAEIAQAWLLANILKTRYKYAATTMVAAVLTANTAFEITSMDIFLSNHKTMQQKMLWLQQHIQQTYQAPNPDTPLVVHNSAARYYFGCTPDNYTLRCFDKLTKNPLRKAGTWQSPLFTGYRIKDHIFLLSRNKEPQIAMNLGKYRIASFPDCGFFLHKIPKSARTLEELNNVMFELVPTAKQTKNDQ